MALPIADARADVASIFLAYLGRAPEYQAMSYYVSLYQSIYSAEGEDRDAAFRALSATVYNDAGNAGEIPTGDNVSSGEYVNWIYLNVLGRQADDDGLDYWTAQLESGALAREELVAIVLEAAKGDERDAAYVANRTQVAVEFAKWANSNPNILDSLQFDAKQILAGVNETEASVDAALGRIEDNAGGDNGGGDIGGIELTLGRDQLQGTSGDDDFYAPIIDNSNTLQNGDAINGGAGVDTLYAEIGNSQAFAIQPVLTNVNNVVISARTISVDGTDNNTGAGRAVQIDAGRTQGTDNWESRDSRADVIIEDVRLNFTTQNITRDITITFRDADPGNVDFAVYIDQQSLIAADVITTNRLSITIANPLERALGYDPEAPLEDVPYDRFTFIYNGEQRTVELDLTDVRTYDDLDAALREAFAEYPEIQIARAEGADSFFSRDGELRTSDVFTLSVVSGSLTPAQIGWNASAGLPSDNAFSAVVRQGEPDSTVPLITSTVVLDNVGRGSTAGDLVIGGLSTGDTSTSRGVEQFDITVEQSSKLQTISSTNNTLEVINLVNDGVYRDVENGRLTEERPGNLAVLGAVDVAGFGFETWINKADLPGSVGDEDIVGATGQNNGFGITDVRVVNAAEYLGDISLTAVLTADVAEKFMNPIDGAPSQNELDDIQFQYTFGSGDDAVAVAISSANLALAGASSREDFNLVIDGGAGDDVIEVAVYDEDLWADDDGFATGGAVDNLSVGGNWYTNSKYNANLAITAGEGNDTVQTYGTGDWFVDLGTGNDTVYLASSGEAEDRAVWVFNSTNTELNNLEGDTNNAYNMFNVRLSVSLDRDANGSGVVSTYTSGQVIIPNNGAVRTTDLNVNQAIKTAINEDPVLSKLLIATDGPSNSLVVYSLIDGEQVSADDLGITLTAPTVAQLSAADIGAWNTARGTTDSAATIQGLIAAEIATFNGVGDYDAEFATDAGLTLGGVDSIYQGDNTVFLGSGNNVVVLGTNTTDTHGAVADTFDSTLTQRVTESVGSNDVLVYENFDNGLDTIVNFTFGAAGTAGVDFLDFTAYDTENVFVVTGLADAAAFNAAKASFATAGTQIVDLGAGGVAATNDSFIRLVEYHNDAGKYDIQLVSYGATAGGNADDTIQLIGTIDFGASQDGVMSDYNFILA